MQPNILALSDIAVQALEAIITSLPLGTERSRFAAALHAAKRADSEMRGAAEIAYALAVGGE